MKLFLVRTVFEEQSYDINGRTFFHKIYKGREKISELHLASLGALSDRNNQVYLETDEGHMLRCEYDAAFTEKLKNND